MMSRRVERLTCAEVQDRLDAWIDESAAQQVLDTAKRQQWTERATLSCVVVHDVENDLNSCSVHRPDKRLELVDLLAPTARR